MTEMSAPHIRKRQNAPQIYMDVVIALLPCCVAAIYAYGLRAAVLLLWGALLHTLSDYVFERFVRREQVYLDASGLISGLILVLFLPPTVSLWVVSAGILFSSVVVKQFFGGVGSNLFNPALAGRAFLAVAFAETTSTLAEPLTGRWSLMTLITGPQDAVSVMTGNPGWLEMLSGLIPGAMGLTGALLAAAGAAYLFFRGILKLHAPLAYIITISVGYWFFFLETATAEGMLRLLLTSGVVFCAVFALGDFSTVPTSGSGRIAFGIGTGLFALMMFAFGQTTLAVVFPVLLMNGVTPILEFYIRPRIFAQHPWYSRKTDILDEHLVEAKSTDEHIGEAESTDEHTREEKSTDEHTGEAEVRV